MKKKTKKLTMFMEELHEHISTSPFLRKNVKGKSEVQLQAEIRPLILDFLVRHFKEEGYKDPVQKANKSFYWEGQEGKYGRDRKMTFGARNYPDFIITDPYLIAIEYKRSENGGVVKHGIGQSIIHTMSEDFDYVYYLFADGSKDKRILEHANKECEQDILKTVWNDFNVLAKII